MPLDPKILKNPGGHGTGILCSTGARVLASSMVVLHAIERAAETHAHVGHGVSLHVAAKDRVEKLLLDACGAGGATAQEDLGAIVELCHAAAPPAAAESDSGSGAEEGLGAMPSLQAQRLRVWNDPLRNGGKKKHFICAVPGCENPSVSQRARGRERETLQCD